ncbi:PQQ-binding-like beta-propeller repeat protein [Mariniblastus sp.]|nr:PQQ-binding-like beta-propeller repeat protein [Mariniblastus sp.]
MQVKWLAYLLGFLLLAVYCDQLQAQATWSRFRGPNGTGVAADANLPSEWDKPLWQVALAGSGTSSPVAWKDRIFVTSCNAKTAEISLECLSVNDGKRLWIETFEGATYQLHRLNSYATSTPAVDEKHVYVLVVDTNKTLLIALDHSGTEVWRRDFGSFSSSHGFGTSPMVHEGLVVFSHSQSAEQLPPGQPIGKSQLVAVDAMTGKDAWTTDLTTRRVCYGVPSVWKNKDGQQQLVNCNTGDGFYAVAPKTGELLWSALPFKMRVVACPLVVDDMLVGSCGSGGGGNYLVAFRPDEKSAEEPAKPAYKIRKSNYVPSPIAVNGLLFVFSDKGVGQCVDLKTGQQFWQERLASGFSSSPVADKGHVYAVDQEGIVHVIKASKEFEKASEYSLGEPSSATPMIIGDRLFFRTRTKLICVGEPVEDPVTDED